MSQENQTSIVDIFSDWLAEKLQMIPQTDHRANETRDSGTASEFVLLTREDGIADYRHLVTLAYDFVCQLAKRKRQELRNPKRVDKIRLKKPANKVLTLEEAKCICNRFHEPLKQYENYVESFKKSEKGVHDDRHPDGLEGGRWLWWQGDRYDVPKGIVYQLLEFMWGRDSANYDSLFGPVFDHDVAPESLRARFYDANKVLRRIGIPWDLSADSVNRFLTKKRKR